MVLQSQSSLERIQEAFDELCQNIMAEELTDGGRTLRRKGLSTMKLVLSPMETRHETAIRVIVGQVGALGLRLKRLEDPEGAAESAKIETKTEEAFTEALEKSDAPPAE